VILSSVESAHGHFSGSTAWFDALLGLGGSLDVWVKILSDIDGSHGSGALRDGSLAPRCLMDWAG